MKVNTSLRTVTAFKLAGNRCTSIPVACGCQAGELWPALCMSEASVFRHDELREVKTGLFLFWSVLCEKNQPNKIITDMFTFGLYLCFHLNVRIRHNASVSKKG
eukprot:TRINITY_DN454_c0_g1_i2.p1 TRINITY_DN454_c0_g1~~TRINITY_DN454_c0_g1_i2.p1  ORF type:complete len:104 (+),score=6.98 TRINITY_DN454_c0_g1_i2:174-485(+)